jgi:hypothetical protein
VCQANSRQPTSERKPPTWAPDATAACHTWNGLIPSQRSRGDSIEVAPPAEFVAGAVVVGDILGEELHRRRRAASSPGVQRSRSPPAQSGLVGRRPQSSRSSDAG